MSTDKAQHLLRLREESRSGIEPRPLALPLGQTGSQDRAGVPESLDVDVLAVAGEVLQTDVRVQAEVCGVQLVLHCLALHRAELRHRAQPLVGLLHHGPINKQNTYECTRTMGCRA